MDAQNGEVKEANEEEKTHLGVSSKLRDITERTFEMEIPDIVIEFLKVKEGDELQFILDKTEKRIYVEKSEED